VIINLDSIYGQANRLCDYKLRKGQKDSKIKQ